MVKEIEEIGRKKRRAQEDFDKVGMEIGRNDHERKESTQSNNMFTKIMEQRIEGVLGRLGDLGKTDKFYDEIITTANGPKLDNIVVRDYNAARKVIDFLKQERLGRASCLIL